MKKNITLITLTLIGFILGVFVGIASGVSGRDFFWEVFSGTFVGYSFGLALFKQENGIVIGAAFGLIVSLAVDWLAGSNIDMQYKLSFIALCGFTGWHFRDLWKYNLIGTLIGGAIGFVWGLQQSHWFGTVCLPAGFLNASLLAIQISIIGTALASLFFKSVGWRFVVKHSPAK